MRRIAFIMGVLIILVIPIILYVITHTGYHPVSIWPLIQKKDTGERYSVASDVSGYTIKLIDTKYLDSIAENTGIFKPQGVIDPQSYVGGSTARYTITHIRFVIVPIVANMVIRTEGKIDFSSTGGYTVEGDTLVIVVSINDKEASRLAGLQHGFDDVFIRAALQTMWYAHGLSADPFKNADAFMNIQKGVRDYLFGGILPWPIQIDKV
jgi:hypothetical protein